MTTTRTTEAGEIFYLLHFYAGANRAASDLSQMSAQIVQDLQSLLIQDDCAAFRGVESYSFGADFNFIRAR